MAMDIPAVFPPEDSDEFHGMLYAYNHQPFPVALISPDGKWKFLNRAALDFLGVPSVEAAEGMDCSDWGGRLEPAASIGLGKARQTRDPEYYQDRKSGLVFRRLASSFGWAGRVESLLDVTPLYEGNERVISMIDAAPLCCNYWNDKFENIDCNLEAAKLFDLPNKQAYLDHFYELSPEIQPNGKKSSDEAARHIKTAFTAGYDRFEWMHQKLNGDPVPAEITLVKVKTRDGDVVLGYTRDLRSSKSVSDVDDLDWMTNVFNSLPFPVGVASSSGKWLFMNKAGTTMLGMQGPEELEGVSASDWGGRLKPLTTKGEGEIQQHYLDTTTDKIYLRASSPLKDSFGGLVGRVECLQEVTELYEAEERIRIMIDAAPLCCNFWNDKFENVECNLEAAKLFDLPDRKAYLDRFFELSPEYQPNGKKSADEALKHITTAFTEGFDRFEWMHQKLNGEPIPSEITLVLVNHRKGKVVLGYTRDLRKYK